MLPSLETAVLSEERAICRASGGLLRDILDLGRSPLNGFSPAGQPARYHPLILAINDDSGLVQLRYTARSDQYRSSNNTTAHLAALARHITRRVDFQGNELVVDIGGDDDTLLQAYPKHIAKVSYPLLFSSDGISGAPLSAKVITTIDVFDKSDDPVGLARQIADRLAPAGWWVIETPYLPAILGMNNLEAIRCDRLCYYSLHSLEYVLRQANLVIVDVEEEAGNIRAYVQKQGQPSAAVLAMRAKEEDVPDLARFTQHIAYNRLRMLELLARLKIQRKQVIGYGAADGSSTLLHYNGITSHLLPYIADGDPNKQGLVAAGTGIPVMSLEQARGMQPDYFFVLANSDIPLLLKQEREFVRRGGRFIVSTPYLHILPEG